MKTIPLKHEQSAFLQKGGCLEATATLNILLREAQRDCGPLALANLVLTKAFDSISRTAILNRLQETGIPEPFINLIEDLFDGAHELFPYGVIVNTRNGVR